MKSLTWFLVSTLAISGCSRDEGEKEEIAAEPIVLSIDGTVESFGGEDSTVDGGDFFHALSRLAALNGSVELRVRDHVGEMIFLIAAEADLGGVIADLMSIEIRSQSVAMNEQELSEEEFVARLQTYVKVAAMVAARPLIIVFATDSSRLVDCLKYLRLLYDGGVNSFIVPPHR